MTSYIVGNLTPGGTYYFVVAAVVDNGCPVSGPFSNELSNISAGGILGVEKILAASEGEIGEGVSSEVGEVAGEATPVCPWWWVVLAAEAFLLAGFYGFILLRRKSLKYHWLAAPLVAALVFLADKFAHQWWIPSPYCKYVPWAGLIIAEIETLGYIFFKNRKV